MASTSTPQSTGGVNTSMGFTPNSGMTAADMASSAGISAAPNILGNYEQVAYHWKFFVAAENKGAASAYGPGSQNDSGVIIAESGVTGFNIQEVIFENTVGPNFLTQNVGAEKFTIKVLEPYGCSLPDKMILSANAMGVKNYMKAPWFLQLSFLGYDESGSPVNPIGGTNWTWRVLVIKLSTDFTATGSLHTLECVGFNDMAHFNQFSMLQTAVTVDVSKEGQPTIGTVLQKAIEEINRSVKLRYGGDDMITYSVEDKPYQGGNAGVSKPFEHKISRETKYHDSSRNQEKMQVSMGTDIPRLIDMLLSSSETAVKLANPGTAADKLDAGGKPTTIIHRIDSTVELGDYVEKWRDYKRKIKYTVQPYEILRTAASEPQAKEAEESTAQGKLGVAKSKNYLKKQYDYLFTGLNTEVLDLDIKINFQFTLVTQLYGGYRHLDAGSPGRELNSDERKKLKQLDQQQSSPGSTTGSNNSGTPSQQYAEDLQVSQFNPLPYGYTESGANPRFNVQPAVESNNLRSRSIFGTILNQLYGSMDDNLANIHLEVRGDPYWLGKDNMSGGGSGGSTDTTPDFALGEHMFVLKFMIPSGINEETGDPILQASDMYSGFYAVIRVENKFIMGKFTQVLHAVRVPGMQVSKLLGGK